MSRSRPLAVLLPPSEGKAAGGTTPGWKVTDGRFGPALARDRRAVARALRAVDGGDQKLLGVGGATLDRARGANRRLVGAPCLPAWQRFTGVVWDHLDVPTLTPAARRRAMDAVVVVSGVAGLVALDDPLPDHRLKLSASLPELGRVATFWRASLSTVLNDHLAGRLVIDLLPSEHAAAWTVTPERYDLRRVVLLGPDGRAVGHDAKAAKGELARALVSARAPEQVLTAWSHPRFELAVVAPG